MKKHILFVDDEINILQALKRMLAPQAELWDMCFHHQPEKAWEELLSHDFDAVVLDVKMQGLDGFEFLARMQCQESTKKIPVVILSGMQDCTLKRRMLERGATDLLTKPVEPADLVARLKSVLRLKESQDALQQENMKLEKMVRQCTIELLQAHREIVWRLGKFAEERDKKTGNHIIRVGLFSHAIAETMNLDPVFTETIGIVAPLHDIGKITISDEILFKNGPLTPQELAVMRRHSWLGAKILRGDSKVRQAFLRWEAPADGFSSVQTKNPYLEMAATIAMSHHEKWDGTGYPRQLAGEAIPLEARIVAIADVYDSLTTDRPYCSAYSEESALDWIQKNVGLHFDSQVHAAFLTALPKIRSIRQQFADFENEPDDQAGDQCLENSSGTENDSNNTPAPWSAINEVLDEFSKDACRQSLPQSSP
ncbi:MAG: HD domain-containing phosphohydrolase [Thermoguttaceae bacterium]